MNEGKGGVKFHGASIKETSGQVNKQWTMCAALLTQNKKAPHLRGFEI
jgi:hypothetical protein